MEDILSYLRQIELGPHATTAIAFLESADPCFIGLVVGMFVCLGYKMAGGHTALKSWGMRIGAATFLIHAGYAIYQAGGVDQHELPSIALRAGIVAGAVLAVIWIVLPVFIFLYRHLRLALAAFILYFGYSVITAGEWPADQLPQIALRAGMAAALAVTVAWIFQPIIDAFTAKYLPALASDKKPQRSKKDRETRRLRKLRRQYHEMLAAKTTNPQPAFQSNASNLDDNENGELMSRLQIDMRRRRDKARMTVELSYVLAMPDIGNQLPRDLFEGWVTRYLGDHLSAEEVEENSKQLQTLLAQNLRHGGPEASSFPSLEELNHWLNDERQRIQSLAVPEAEKQRKLLELQENYISLAHRVMADSPPQVVSLPPRITLPMKESRSM